MPVIQDILSRLAPVPVRPEDDPLRTPESAWTQAANWVGSRPVPDWLTHAIGVSPPGSPSWTPVGHQNVGQFVGNWMGSYPMAGASGMIPARGVGRVPQVPEPPPAPAAGEVSRRGFLRQAGRAALGAGGALAGGTVVGKMLKGAEQQGPHIPKRFGDLYIKDPSGPGGYWVQHLTSFDHAPTGQRWHVLADGELPEQHFVVTEEWLRKNAHTQIPRAVDPTVKTSWGNRILHLTGEPP